MSKLNERKVVHATLHEGTFLPGLGPIPKDLSASMVGEVKVLAMSIEVPFVVIQFKNSKGVEKEIAFDTSLFKHLVLETPHKPLPKPLK